MDTTDSQGPDFKTALVVGWFQTQLRLVSTHCRAQNDLELLTLPPSA